MFDDDYNWWDEPGMKASCPKCGTPHVPVRPGKTQPNCECDSICEYCGGRIEYHLEPDPRWPRVAGYFCNDCGPFPGLTEEEG